MTATIVDIGDMRRIGNHSTDPVTGLPTGLAAFTDEGGDETDPTEVRLTIRKPDGTQLVYVWPTADVDELDLTKEDAATGRFYADVEIDQAGNWPIRLQGTGTVTAAAEDYLRARQSLLW